MSNMRISGIVSGMDTDSIVQNMMKVERLKVSRYEQNKQIALWRQEAYNSTNKMFANFILNSKKDMGLTKASSTGLLTGNSYTRLDYVRKATSSNELAATVSSTSGAVNGSFSLKVVGLAESATYASKEVAKDTTFGDSLTLNIDGKTIEINKENIKMEDVAKAINDKKIGMTAFYDQNKQRLFIQTNEAVDGKEIDLTSTNTLFNEAINGIDGNESTKVKGKSAEVEFNGVILKYASNNFALNGINIEAKSIGTTTINVSTNVEGIMEKVEKLINDYNELVDKASKLTSEKKYAGYKPLTMEEKKAMGEDDAKLWEEKAKSGLLNRDETLERTLQTARIELYKKVEGLEGKFDHITQVGISTVSYTRGSAGGKLQIDTEKLRKAIEEDPEGVMELLFKEADKLPRETYPNNDEGNRAYEIADKAYRNANSGIFTRVYDTLIDGMKSIIDKSGPGQDSDLFRSVKSNILIDFVTKKSSISDIDKQVLDMNRQLDNLNILLAKKEDSYYAKFTQMEKYMQQMSGQSSWLSQQSMR